MRYAGTSGIMHADTINEAQAILSLTM